MILRLVLLALVIMILWRVTGKWLRPRVPPKRPGAAIETARKCPTCGAYVVGAGPCDSPGCAAPRNV